MSGRVTDAVGQLQDSREGVERVMVVADLAVGIAPRADIANNRHDLGGQGKIVFFAGFFRGSFEVTQWLPVRYAEKSGGVAFDRTRISIGIEDMRGGKRVEEFLKVVALEQKIDFRAGEIFASAICRTKACCFEVKLTIEQVLHVRQSL